MYKSENQQDTESLINELRIQIQNNQVAIHKIQASEEKLKRVNESLRIEFNSTKMQNEILIKEKASLVNQTQELTEMLKIREEKCTIIPYESSQSNNINIIENYAKIKNEILLQMTQENSKCMKEIQNIYEKEKENLSFELKQKEEKCKNLELLLQNKMTEILNYSNENVKQQGIITNYLKELQKYRENSEQLNDSYSHLNCDINNKIETINSLQKLSYQYFEQIEILKKKNDEEEKNITSLRMGYLDQISKIKNENEILKEQLISQEANYKKSLRSKSQCLDNSKLEYSTKISSRIIRLRQNFNFERINEMNISINPSYKKETLNDQERKEKIVQQYIQISNEINHKIPQESSEYVINLENKCKHWENEKTRFEKMLASVIEKSKEFFNNHIEDEKNISFDELSKFFRELLKENSKLKEDLSEEQKKNSIIKENANKIDNLIINSYLLHLNSVVVNQNIENQIFKSKNPNVMISIHHNIRLLENEINSLKNEKNQIIFELKCYNQKVENELNQTLEQIILQYQKELSKVQILTNENHLYKEKLENALNIERQLQNRIDQYEIKEFNNKKEIRELNESQIEVNLQFTINQENLNNKLKILENEMQILRNEDMKKANEIENLKNQLSKFSSGSDITLSQLKCENLVVLNKNLKQNIQNLNKELKEIHKKYVETNNSQEINVFIGTVENYKNFDLLINKLQALIEGQEKLLPINDNNSSPDILKLKELIKNQDEFYSNIINDYERSLHLEIKKNKDSEVKFSLTNQDLMKRNSELEKKLIDETEKCNKMNNDFEFTLNTYKESTNKQKDSFHQFELTVNEKNENIMKLQSDVDTLKEALKDAELVKADKSSYISSNENLLLKEQIKNIEATIIIKDSEIASLKNIIDKNIETIEKINNENNKPISQNIEAFSDMNIENMIKDIKELRIKNQNLEKINSDINFQLLLLRQEVTNIKNINSILKKEFQEFENLKLENISLSLKCKILILKGDQSKKMLEMTSKRNCELESQICNFKFEKNVIDKTILQSDQNKIDQTEKAKRNLFELHKKSKRIISIQTSKIKELQIRNTILENSIEKSLESDENEEIKKKRFHSDLI